MNNFEEWIALARSLGFEQAQIIETKDIPITPEFRKYCEDNLCGKFGVNYSCPPDCGTTDEMRARLCSKRYALVLKTIWDIDFRDASLVKQNKGAHNRLIRQLIKELPQELQGGIMVAASGCSLCEVCTIVDGLPCRFPEQMASCVSAYCVNVAELCKILGWEYWVEERVGFFGMYLFD